MGNLLVQQIIVGNYTSIFIMVTGIKTSYRDTMYTRLEDKIAYIISFLEIKSEEIKEERKEREHQKMIQEGKGRIRKEFAEKRANELQECKSFFNMFERLFKANMIRESIETYEKYLLENNISDKDILEKVQWAKDKADWLDSFISKKNLYMDYYDKDKVMQPNCPKQHGENRNSNSSDSAHKF